MVSTQSEVSDIGSDPSPWTKPWFILSAMTMLVIVALALVLIVSSLFTDDPGGGGVIGAGDGLPPTESVEQTSPSVCGLTAVAMTGTITQPPPAEWSLVGTIAVPSSPQIGPGEVFPDQFRRCFAQTPQGALFSAANITGVGSVKTLARKVAAWYTAEGPGRQEVIDTAGTHGGSAEGAAIRLQIAGFRVLNYTGDTATVDLAYRVSNGAYVSQIFDLVWENGDWRARISPSGDGPLTPGAQIPDITGYIPWGGA